MKALEEIFMEDNLQLGLTTPGPLDAGIAGPRLLSAHDVLLLSLSQIRCLRGASLLFAPDNY